MKVFLGSDHVGFVLKEKIKQYLKNKKITFVDLGPARLVNDDDYPDIAYQVARQVVKSKGRGILVCRNGVGVCVVANKVKGARAVNTDNLAVVKSARQDDDVNILCLGQAYVSEVKAKKIINVWLKTEFSGLSRHVRRIKKIQKIESK
ncbi:MAG: RpiB/LacA/LacB family sugar-phosphate isomerase [Candidatus Buchananbacteria bacterium]|nr:RpiB/LacA/LacB family sugar-phosphate isomerase [Candidatus Buchananbacteria bacterium]